MNEDATQALRDAMQVLGAQATLTSSAEAILRRLAPAVDEHTRCFEDLCLAGYCLEGDTGAIALFVARYGEPLRRVIARTCATQVDADDVLQDVLVKLFLGNPPAPPSLGGYRGHGALQAWLGVVAARTAVDLVRRPNVLNVADTLLSSMELPKVADGARVLELREFKLALERAVRSLGNTDRQILRLHLGGMIAEDIGRAMGMHRVSVARRLSAIRLGIRDATLLNLGANAQSLASDISQLSVSLERLLGTGN